MASLCISPVHAGIKPFSTANSSFIFDRRRRSIRLCAVFLAIFRPAALDVEGCFFFDPAGAVDFEAGVALTGVGGLAAASSWARGFICIIFRDRVGGGGRAKASFCAADERLLYLTVSLAWTGKGIFGEAACWLLMAAMAFASELEGRELWPPMADGGSSNDICNVDNC